MINKFYDYQQTSLVIYSKQLPLAFHLSCKIEIYIYIPENSIFKKTILINTRNIPL